MLILMMTLFSTMPISHAEPIIEPTIDSPLSPNDAQSVTITYTANFDLIGGLEKIACQTGLCDCEAVYTGSGTLHANGDHVYTFRGLFSRVSGECHENLTFWTPPDKKAYHTLHFSDDESTLTTWVAHRKHKDTSPFEASHGIKENGQCYLSEMTAAVSADGRIQHTESDTGKAGPFTLTSTHTLDIRLAR